MKKAVRHTDRQTDRKVAQLTLKRIDFSSSLFPPPSLLIVFLHIPFSIPESESTTIPRASTVICPVSKEPDEVWVDVAGTPGTRFNITITAEGNDVTVDEPKQV